MTVKHFGYWLGFFAVASLAVGVIALNGLREHPVEVELADIGQLPDGVVVAFEGTAPCRGSGKIGFVFWDYVLDIDPELSAADELGQWLLANGFDSVEDSGEFGFVSGHAGAEIFSMARFLGEAWLPSPGIRSEGTVDQFVLRLWPLVPCVE